MPERAIMPDMLEKPAFEGVVLVCEDNLMNQRVITDHLSWVGLHAVIAANGQEGVDLVRSRMQEGKKAFDLIFMDIHMPVMDGLEAAPKILELNTGTPIVAMTANIMADDMDLYRKHGMPDCVGKPFTSQVLWRCLLKYLTPVNRQTEQAEAQDDGKAHHTLLADCVKEHNAALYRQLLADFVQGNQATCSEITDALAAGDVQRAYRLAHSLKSAAALLGKHTLQQAAADVELLLADEKNLVTEDQLSVLENELRSVLTELAPIVAKNAL
jgi:CheY-like chemotaxis protein